MSQISNLKFYPLTPERWVDLEKLFGEKGACGGCWCMHWRLERSEFEQGKGRKNKEALKRLVASGEIPGVLAFANGEPIGWCSVAPRESFPTLERSRVLAKVDDMPVWSVVCLYVAKPFRRKGVSSELLRAAVDHVRKRGGKIVEGYPVEPKTMLPDPFVYTGLVAAFRKARFTEVLRRSKTRPIMRLSIEQEKHNRLQRFKSNTH